MLKKVKHSNCLIGSYKVGTFVYLNISTLRDQALQNVDRLVEVLN